MLIGRITEVGSSEIKMKTGLGEISIEIIKISEIREVPSASMKEGKYWFPDPNESRLIIGPSGRMLKRGKGYFSDVLIFFPQIAYGISDRFSIGGGMTIFPGIDMNKQFYFAQPKLGFNLSPNFDVAVSAMIFRIPEIDDVLPKTVGILFTSATIGSQDRSLTAGLGYGFVEDELADKPAVMLGGKTRVSRRMALVTENWIVPGADDPLISYGVRFFGEDMAVDLAFFTILDSDALFPGIPVVSFTWNF
jgi:hypothetical protein